MRTDLPWALLLVWFGLQLPVFAGLESRGQTPIDFLSYRRAASAIARGTSPYLTSEQDGAIWLAYHRLDLDLRAADRAGRGALALQEIGAGPERPGPYLYPPTLALLVGQLRLGAPAFAALTLVAIVGFARLWFASAGLGVAFLPFVALSWDVLASWYGGNVELVLVFLLLLAARLQWDDRRAVLAAPAIALVVLIKPFDLLFFVAFALIRLASAGETRLSTLRALAGSAVLALLVCGVEILRWGPELRAAAWDYLRHSLDATWLVLPPAEQTPMSAWNRTPLQALVNAGLRLDLATGLALALWCACLAATLFRARQRPISFPVAFALAFTLLYLGRPVGWGLIYLEVVVLGVAQPGRAHRQRVVLVLAALALVASHWAALALTLGGHGLGLFTLQSVDLPWETMLVLPLSWLLVLAGAKEPPAGTRISETAAGVGSEAG
jgi:hypothetical protein